jgi:predicted O-linked N-acetylglucosamine transferase (SPINDLY family)
MLQFVPNQLLRLGLLHQQRGEFQQAEAVFRQVLAQDPNHPRALHLLGMVLGQTGNTEAAVELVRRAMALDPQDHKMYNNLGNWLRELGRFDEAIPVLREAVRLAPGSSLARFNLALALQHGGELDEAIGALREALRLSPDEPSIHSDLIFLLQCHPEHCAQALREELAIWRRHHADPLRKYMQPHTNDRSPDRPLRIGYVSPDFRDHVVAWNILPLIEHHDPRQFSVFCFAELAAPDVVTDRFRSRATDFQIITGRSDQEVADLIRAGKIDILVDLALHTVSNRLLVFARKPAPVQVTFAGYPGSTGLDTIDYRLTDPHLDPPGQDDSIYSEASVRLPDSFWCYTPPAETHPVNDLPALSTGHVTFGCLNSYRKVNTSLLKLWARVLQAVPSARLTMLAPLGTPQLALELMAAQGIAAHRLSFQKMRPRHKYLELYHDIDIGLDTHPYNGHTTSLDSFFMGVPVITRVGDTVVGRAGVSQLMNLGLPELIAHNEEQFVEIAAALAADLPRLAALRRNLRPRMQASPLMDAPRFARNIENAYRGMWRRWCV